MNFPELQYRMPIMPVRKVLAPSITAWLLGAWLAWKAPQDSTPPNRSPAPKDGMLPTQTDLKKQVFRSTETKKNTFFKFDSDQMKRQRHEAFKSTQPSYLQLRLSLNKKISSSTYAKDCANFKSIYSEWVFTRDIQEIYPMQAYTQTGIS